MLRVKVKSLIDTSLNTGTQEYNVSRGQVFTCELKCQEVLDDLVRIGVLELVDPNEPERKPLPVFFPPPKLVEASLCSLSGEPLPLSGNIDGRLEQGV